MTRNVEQHEVNCLLLLGTRSSGASVLAGCLHYLGVSLGEGVMPLSPSKETGYWQIQDLVLVHDILLRDLGCHRDMIGSLPPGWVESEAATRAKQSIRNILERNFADKGLWAVQEPRLYRFMPLWEPLLQEMGFSPGYILTLRHPWEVARSLQECEGWDLLKGHLFWLAHNREALESCRDKPHTVITYDQVLADPISTLKEVEERLDVVYPRPLPQQHRRILEFVRPDLKHHHLGEQEETGIGSTNFAHFAHLYDQFRFHQAGSALQPAKQGQPATQETFPLDKTAVCFSLQPAPSTAVQRPDNPASQIQSEQHGEKIFKDMLSLIGGFERAEHGFERQKEWKILNSSRPGGILYAQVFFPSPANGEYAQDRSAKFLLPQEEWQKISVAIPDSRLLREQPLRFDPLNTKGMVSISTMQLVNPATGRICWSAAKPGDYDQLRLHKVLRLPNRDGLLLMIYSREARIILPILPELPDCPLEFQVWIKAGTNLEGIEKLWEQEQHYHRQLRQELEQVSQREDAGKRELAARDLSLAEAAERELRLNQELQTQSQALAEAAERESNLDQEVQSQSQALAEAAEREACLDQEVQSQSQALAEAAEREARLDQEVQSQSQALAEAAERESNLDQALAETRNRLAEQTWRLDKAEAAAHNKAQALAEANRLATAYKQLIQRYSNAFEQLERDYIAVKESARWRAGNRLIRCIEVLLLRKKPRLVMDHMQETFDASKTWQHEPLPDSSTSSSAPAQDPEQLRSWLKQIDHDLQALLESWRWRLGNALVRAVEIGLLRRKTPLAVDHMRKIFDQHDTWSSTGFEHQDIDQLVSWLEQVKSDYQALIDSKRWRVGDSIVSLIEKALLRGRRPMATDHIQEIFARFDSWRQIYDARPRNRPGRLKSKTDGFEALPSSLPTNVRESITPTPSNAPSPLNVLFVLPQSIDSNNGYHAQGVADRLAPLGVDCVFATTNGKAAGDEATRFPVRSFAEIKEQGPGFRDGRGPDIIHAWTPREVVRKFCIELREKYPAKLAIHLEDNEEYLTEAYTGKSWQELRSLSARELDQQLPDSRFHPLHGPAWLAEADGLTLVIDTLERFNVAGAPSILLPPIVDERLFYPRPVNVALRRKLGIPEDHVVLVYTGNVHAANQEEVGTLYRAVDLLNQQGCPTTLIRTGRDPDSLSQDACPQTHVVRLDWVARNELPDILAAADFFVQPGTPGPFNDLRVPSKLPEYFAMGRPVILPKTNLGLQVEHERDAYVLDMADEHGISGAVQTLKADQALSRRLAVGAAAFHRAKLDRSRLGEGLFRFYETTLLNLQSNVSMARSA